MIDPASPSITSAQFLALASASPLRRRHAGEGLTVLVVPHQHGQAGNRGQAKAARHAGFRIGLDFGIAFASDLFPFSRRLLDFDTGDGGLSTSRTIGGCGAEGLVRLG